MSVKARQVATVHKPIPRLKPRYAWVLLVVFDNLTKHIFFTESVLFGKTMPSQPPAPDSLPQYLVEGVPKQDETDLRALQDWIDDLRGRCQ
ncbi:MAG: hypothetical protein J07HR59_00660 [Halorubrum sp. J07HR59]|nr:MAG: hypothetical protein J07HR59_00660 [Halorubrum sp. J07HR59]